MALRLLLRRRGDLAPTTAKRVTALPLPQIEALTEALLGFSSQRDLHQWLREHGTVCRRATAKKTTRSKTK